MTCGTCGAELSAAARFCDQCGTPVPQGVPPQELRKTVTLLFTDVTGSTALGEQLDPEAYRSIMGRYFELARAAVERHGGTVEKFVGDAVLAVFGIPEVREDDALRAVRAAMEMSTAIQALSDQLTQSNGVRLEVRTGVNTGSVVAGSARAGGAFATGDAVNTAARLEQAAAPGTVLIGESTYALVRDAVEVTAVDPVEAKGKADPVPAYQLRAVEDVDHGRARRRDTRLVGRDRESRVLVDVLERTLETRRGHLVTVVGAPGIGKTRLISDFLERVDGRAAVLTSRCVSYGQGITFWPIVQLLRQAVGLQGDESDELTRHTLAEFMGDVEDSPQVVDRLLPLLGKAGEPAGTEETFWAVRRALEQLASSRPVVVTVDDLHWAEPTLLELIERVREEMLDLPLLLVCQTRPELLDDRPGWGGSLNSTIFGLEPFSSEQTADSLSDLLGDRVEAEVGRTVAAWAGGNPLFVEEAATHLVEEGLLRHGPDGWRLTGDLASTRVPPTVAALLAARLDRLPDLERRLVQRLSIAGLELTTDDAVFLAEGLVEAAEVPATLASLAHRDLLRRRRNHANEIWAFRHLMVRDAAYDSLPKALRAELHERFASRIESSGDDAGVERHAFAAHHLRQALSLRRELAPHDPRLAELADRSAESLMRAARAARDLEDLVTTMHLLETAATIEPLPPSRRRSIIVEHFRVALDRGIPSEMTRLAAAYRDALDPEPAPLQLAAETLLLTAARLELAEPVPPDDLSERARRCEELARESEDRSLLLLALQCAASANMMRAQWVRVREDLQEVIALGDAQDRRRARLLLGSCVVWGAEPIQDLSVLADEAESRGVHTAAEVEEISLFRLMVEAASGDPTAPDRAAAAWRETETAMWPMFREIMIGVCAAMGGDNDLAIVALDSVVKRMVDVDDFVHASTELGWTVALRLERGDDPDEVEPDLERAAEYTSPYDAISVAIVLCGRGLLAARRRHFDEADEHLAEAVRVTATTDQAWQLADIYRWWSSSKAAQGDTAGERRLLELAGEVYHRKGLIEWARRCAARAAQLAGS